jgi:hypothetical protein
MASVVQSDIVSDHSPELVSPYDSYWAFTVANTVERERSLYVEVYCLGGVAAE